MLKKKYIVTVDLGYGDSGKGSVVDFLTKYHNSKLVVRYNGGFQASHNVHTDDGRSHNFSQFGSGTFQGAKTLLTREVVVNPLVMQVEINRLKEKKVPGFLCKPYVHEDCLVTTPYHKALNQIRELSRKNHHGSTGNGIGEAQRLQYFGNVRVASLYVSDIDKSCTLRLILNDLHSYMYSQCLELIHDYDLTGKQVAEAMSVFSVPDGLNILIERYQQWYDQVLIVNDSFINDLLNKENAPVIFEGSQGVLLDKQHGFYPYTSWGDTTDDLASHILDFISDDIEIQTIGITRTFLTRHGAGPLITENIECLDLIKDDDNYSGVFQGGLRVGYLDLPLLKYAISKCHKIDGLAFTHCDKLNNPVARKLCYAYDGLDLSKYNCADEAGKDAFEFTASYKNNKPVMVENVADLPSFISRELEIPILIKSFGKTTSTKIINMGMPQDDTLETEPLKKTEPQAPVSTEAKPEESKVVKTDDSVTTTK